MSLSRCLLQLSQLRGLAHGDQGIAGLNDVVGRRIESHALLALDGENNYAAFLADARTSNRFAGEVGICTYRDFADLEIHAEVRSCGIKEADNVRAKERLRDALARK